ncbi:MAG: hypothetical protein HKN32_00895 [Flavobacteriales bacterium]|nr:hypothetical protein [Flavobacteriales bacterium]
MLSIFDRVILIILMTALLWGNVMDGPFQIEWFVYGQTFAYCLAVILGFGLVLYRAGKVRFKFDRAFMVAILKKSFPYALLVFLMAVYFRTDSVMLERMHPKGAFEAGIYAMGYRFFEAANMIAFLFGGMLLPIFSRMIRQKENVQPIVSLSFKILLSGAIILAACCYCLPEEILSLRYIRHVGLAGPVFAILMVGFVFVCCTYIFGTLLTASGNLKRLNQFAIGAVLLNIGLNVALIPEYGAFGCAFASCLTLALVAILQMFEAQRHFRFRITKGFRKTLLIFLVGMGALILSATFLDLNWKVELLGIGILGLGIAMATGMLHMGRFIDLIANRKD